MSPRLSDVRLLVLLSAVRFVVNAATNEGYGFHRDELATLDDSRYLAWGYTAYPPLMAFVGRLALELFGATPIGPRVFSALAVTMANLLTGLVAREMGAGRRGQVLAVAAATIAPLSWGASTLFQYVAFDFLLWQLVVCFAVRLVTSGNERLWLAIGAAIGFGMLTKYTMAICAVALTLAFLATPWRRHFARPWPWLGAALALLIFLPNLLWQIRNDFVSLEFLQAIHARDVRIGRTDGFFRDQLLVSLNVFTVPIALGGLLFLFAKAERRFLLFGLWAAMAFAFFYLAEGRGYYTGPIYPLLLAAGAVQWERWLEHRSSRARTVTQYTTAGALLAGGAFVIAFGPYARVGTRHWEIVSEVNTDLREEIGWPELAETVGSIYRSLPPEERARTGVLTANYGEAGAINMYGGPLGLPTAISGVNSYWARGYPDPPPEVLIALGFDGASVDRLFESCALAAHVTNRYGVENEETTQHPEIFVCRRPRQSWPDLWLRLRHFG